MVPTDELEDWHAPSRVRRIVTVVAIVAVAGVAAYFALRPAPGGGPERLPDFELEKLSGGTMSSEELEGHPVVLNFFASWCAPCRDEAPLLESTYRRYRDDGVIFLGVNVRDEPEPAAAFVRRFDITYPVIRDPKREVYKALDAFGLPVTYFIDSSGDLVASQAGEELGTQEGTTYLGAISRAELEAGIERLLEREEDL